MGALWGGGDVEDGMSTMLTGTDVWIALEGAHVRLVSADAPPVRLTAAQAREYGQALVRAACAVSLRHGHEGCDCTDGAETVRADRDRLFDEHEDLEERVKELEDELADARR